MKTLIIVIIAFSIGILGGIRLGKSMQLRAILVSHEYASTFTKAMFTRFFPPIWKQYHYPWVRIPIPATLDLSTNTLQQLTFWRSFAREYSLYNDPDTFAHPPARVETDPIPLVELSDARSSTKLAYEASSMMKKGASFDEVRQWVSDHAQMAMADTNAFAKLLSEHGEPQPSPRD